MAEEAKEHATEEAYAELEGAIGGFDEEDPDFMSEDRLEAIRILSTYHELAGLELHVQTGDLVVTKVWPTAQVKQELFSGEGDRTDFEHYLPSLDERLALTAYINARKDELEARATRLWLKEIKQASIWRSILLVLKPLGFESVETALDQSLGDLRDHPELGLPPDRLEKYVRAVASKDMFLRMSSKQRASWLTTSARISAPKAGDELLAVITADGVRHDVRSDHAKYMARPLTKSSKRVQPEVIKAFELLDADKSKMLDMDELNEGFVAMGISRSDKQVRKVLTKIDDGGDRQCMLPGGRTRCLCKAAPCANVLSSIPGSSRLGLRV